MTLRSCLVAAALALLVAPAAADPLDDAAARIAAVGGIDALLAACPADIQGTWPGGFLAGDWPLAACEANVEACAEACIGRRGAEACLRMSRLYELQGDDRHEIALRQFYALSCALGRPNACTNRGSQIRNAPWRGDALSRGPIDKTAGCRLRTFEQACDGDDAWGCAMAGQAWRLGEGKAPDPDRARARYERACELLPTPTGPTSASDPCGFARDGLAAMARR